MNEGTLSLPFTKFSFRYGSRQFPLHAMTILSGHSRETSVDYYNDGKTLKGGVHVVWQYTLSGRGQLQHENRTWDLLPGSLMIITMPGAYSYFLPSDSEHWEFLFVTMVGREVIRIARIIEKRWGPILSMEKLPETRAFLGFMIQRLLSGEIDNPFINSCLTYQFCMQFLEEEVKTKVEPDRYHFSALDTFLKDNLCQDISVADMAEFMHLSRSHFTTVFTREMGISPRLYFEDLRLKTAMSMLLEEEITVKETAIRCGIPDVNYFCRLFKKRNGISPGRYRARELSSPNSAHNL